MGAGVEILDLHGKTVYQARVALDARLRRAGAGTYRLRVLPMAATAARRCGR